MNYGCAKCVNPAHTLVSGTAYCPHHGREALKRVESREQREKVTTVRVGDVWYHSGRHIECHVTALRKDEHDRPWVNYTIYTDRWETATPSSDLQDDFLYRQGYKFLHHLPDQR